MKLECKCKIFPVTHILREINFDECRNCNFICNAFWIYFCQCLHITVWKFMNFPAILILREINFDWLQKGKNCCHNNFEGLEFTFLEKFLTWKCQKFPKIQNSEVSNWLKWQFWGLQNNQNWFHVKIWVAEKSWNFAKSKFTA